MYLSAQRTILWAVLLSIFANFMFYIANVKRNIADVNIDGANVKLNIADVNIAGGNVKM
jgi:hypothetical protein